MELTGMGFVPLILAAMCGGMINAVAGGGTLVTFPVLLGVVPPVVANATSTLALVQGSLSGAWGYRGELKTIKKWLPYLIPPSILGGVFGSLLLTRLNPAYFSKLIPWLLFLATLLFIAQPFLSRWIGKGKKENNELTPFHLVGLVFFQFLVSVYGGYFGAGLGILMLSALSLSGFHDIHQMNGLKTLLGSFINGVSAMIFIWEGKVDWHLVFPMAIAAMVGGYIGAAASQRINRTYVRRMVIVIGLFLTTHYFLKGM